MLIQMCLLFALAVFSLMDHFQTIALIELGYEEVNPIVLAIVGQDKNWDNLLIVKVSLLILCGALLIINYYKKRR